jgi:hypothetical protein
MVTALMDHHRGSLTYKAEEHKGKYILEIFREG